MRKLFSLVVVAAVALLGCSAVNRIGSLAFGDGAVTQDELREKVLGFSSTFEVLVIEAADQISQGTNDARQRRLTLLWKIRMPPLAQQAASDPNPRGGYVEALTVAVAQRLYFAEGAGKSLFGAQQPIALETAQDIEIHALAIGASFLPPPKLAELHAEVEELARQHPLRGEFLRESIQIGLVKAESGGAFDDIVSIPMAPFRAVAGVESGAQAIHEFNATAAQFTEVVDALPQRVFVFECAGFRGHQTQHNHFVAWQKAQRLKPPRALGVILHEVHIDIKRIEQQVGNWLITSLSDPRRTEVAAAQMHSQRHLGGTLCNGQIDQRGVSLREAFRVLTAGPQVRLLLGVAQIG